MGFGERATRRRAALVGALLLAGCVLVFATRAAPVKGSQRANFLLSSSTVGQMVPRALQPLLSQVRPVAATAVGLRPTTLGKTLTLERIIHTVLRGRHATCWGYSTVMVALGRELGLPLRITFGGSSASDYDTHTTVSVWLARYRSWAIVDPTFGGTFTRGGNRRPLNAVDLRDALVHGWWRQIRWHPSASDSTPLKRYYVDPLFLFRYVGAIADVGGGPRPVVLPDAGMLPSSDYAVSPAILATAKPSSTFTPRLLSAAASVDRLELPLPYAPKQVLRRQISLPATIVIPQGSVVVWTSADGVRINRYGTTSVGGGSLSPVFVSNGHVRLSGTGRATIRVFLARRVSS